MRIAENQAMCSVGRIVSAFLVRVMVFVEKESKA